MNSSFAEIRKSITTQIGRDLFYEVEQAPWGAMPLTSIPEISVAIGTGVGLVRTRNEDRVAVAQVAAADGEFYFVVLVCDGVGGTEMGDVAASVAVSAFIEELTHNRSKIPLAKLLPLLIRRVDERVREVLHGRGATTLSVLVSRGGGETISTNIGDSRIYSWSPLKGQLAQVSRDDTIENELEELAIKKPNALRYGAFGSSLSQAIGEDGRSSHDLRIRILDSGCLDSGVVLATDGAWKGAEDGFNALLKRAQTSTVAVSRAMTFSNWVGGIDNTSIVAIENIKEAASKIPWSEPGELKVRAWLGNSKVILSASSSAATSKLPRLERSIMKSEIRKALAKKNIRSSDDPNKLPKQLDFVEDSGLEKKPNRAKVEITIDPDPKIDSES
ncbi:PP2C family protein-serine/threonine phosphatase [Ectopseudomonas khazarica]|uniref:PP2C family protein-serine/threonine phosphatase n=1 Tax=Ectopseudomonas khazarica TaxID=2502979 RepID=UPI0037CC1DBD